MNWNVPLKLLKETKRLLFPVVTGAVRERADDYSINVPFCGALISSAAFGRVAVVCHLFNVDLAREIHSYISNIPVPNDLYFSTDTEDKAAQIRKEFASFTRGQVNVRVVPNRGRDISHKYITFRDVCESYDLILFLHSKKTAKLRSSADWRRSLMESAVWVARDRCEHSGNIRHE